MHFVCFWHKADIRCGAMQCPLLGVKRTSVATSPMNEEKLVWRLANSKRPSHRICPETEADRTPKGSLLAFMTANREPSNQGFELTGRRRLALRAVASFCDWSLRAARSSLQSHGRSAHLFSSFMLWMRCWLWPKRPSRLPMFFATVARPACKTGRGSMPPFEGYPR